MNPATGVGEMVEGRKCKLLGVGKDTGGASGTRHVKLKVVTVAL